MEHWFRDWFNSPYYSMLYAHRDEKEAAAFIDRLTSHLKPAPGSRMMDVACGKGRHSLQLASQGFDVTGIDLSEKSIEEAKAFEKENLHFYVHDMRLPCWINYFDYAFNFFTSFGYFETMREHHDTLRSIAGALKRGGIFVIDYLNVPYAETHLQNHSEELRDNCTFSIQRTSDRTHFIKKIKITDNSLDRSFAFQEKVAKFSKDELIGLLSANRLEVVEVFGDYALSAFSESQSPRLIIVAKKS